MVPRFNARQIAGGGERDWFVWDNAANGQRGSGFTELEAIAEAAELEVQYDAHGYRDPAAVRTVDPPVPVDVFQPAGVLDRWIFDTGEWFGRVRSADGKYAWINQADLRQAGE